MDARRHDRVAETIREELEEMLNYELSDPRIGPLTITEVILTSDGRRAVARLTLEGAEETERQTLAALNGARRHIRRLLASRLNLFRTPDVSFEAAIDPKSNVKLAYLLRKIHQGRPRETPRGAPEAPSASSVAPASPNRTAPTPPAAALTPARPGETVQQTSAASPTPNNTTPAPPATSANPAPPDGTAPAPPGVSTTPACQGGRVEKLGRGKKVH